MNLPELDRPSPRTEVQLQGPRPTALKLNKDSHKITKPPHENRQPVIIYAVPPKVIHTTVNDYKALVQRLTGNAALSPAARLASLHKTSPPKERDAAGDNDARNFTVGDTNVEMGTVPGILSPAPGNLPSMSPGMFLPISPGKCDPFNMFIPSPSTLFTAPMVLPSPSSYDLFNIFFDF